MSVPVQIQDRQLHVPDICRTADQAVRRRTTDKARVPAYSASNRPITITATAIQVRTRARLQAEAAAEDSPVAEAVEDQAVVAAEAADKSQTDTYPIV